MNIYFSSPNNFVEFLKILIPALIAAFGWIIVFQQAMNLRYGDDIRELTDRANDVIDKIYDLTFEYYNENEDHIGLKSADIRANFLLLSHILLLIKDRGVQTSLSHYINAYRKAVMGDYFETVEFKKQLSIPDRRSDIANSRSELSFRVSQTYFNWSRSNGFFSTLRQRFKKAV